MSLTQSDVQQSQVQQAAELTFPRKTSYRFNEVKDEATGTSTKRDAVAVDIPVPNLQGIIQVIQKGATAKNAGSVVGAILSDEQKHDIKALDYLIEVLGDAVVKEIRGYVSDNANASQDTIPWNKYTFEAIANMPAGIRGATSIAKELWDKFAKSYVTVMSLNGITAEIAAVRAGVFVQKFRPLTGNPERKTIIENLMGTLAIYLERSADKDKEEFSSILEFLDRKADELKKEDTVVTKDALGF